MLIPDHLMTRLTTRAYNILVREGITSCERLLACETADLYRFRGSGRTTVVDLQKLQNKIVKLCPALAQCLKMIRTAPVGTGGQAGQIPDHLLSSLATRTRNVLAREGITSCKEVLQCCTSDLYRFKGSWHGTVQDLQILQDKIVKLHPDLSIYLNRLKALPRKESSEVSPDRPAAEGRPAGWSVLNRSLPELFRLSPPSSSPGIDDEPTIGSLGLSDADLERLRSIAVFPDDSAHLLCSVSLGYLLSAEPTDRTLSLLFDASARACGHAGLPSLPPASADVSDASLYRGISRDLLDSLRFPGFPYPVLLDRPECDGSAPAWSEIANITERRVFECLGFSPFALRVVRYLWLLADSASRIEKASLAGVSPETYRDFRQLVSVYARLGIASRSAAGENIKRTGERDCRIIEARWGMVRGRRQAPDEAVPREGLTRQGAWEVEKKWLAVLKQPQNLNYLVYLRLWLDHLLTAGGGALRVEEIARALQEALGWQADSVQETLGGFADLFPDYRMVCNRKVVVMSGHRCVTCEKIRTALGAALASAPNGELAGDRALQALCDHCRTLRCPGKEAVVGFSTAFLQQLVESSAQIYIHRDVLRAKGVWLSTADMRRNDLEQIVRSAGQKGIHFKEVALLYDRLRPDKPFSMKDVHARLSFSPLFLLWGRGAFIHRDLVALPRELLAEIGADLRSRLNADDIPYVFINGVVFERYAQRLKSENIANPTALYTALREAGSEELKFEEYPYVGKKEEVRPRPQVTAVLQEFVKKQQGEISTRRIKNFGTLTLGIPKNMFPIYFMLPDVLRIDRVSYRYFDVAAFDRRRLAPVVRYLREVVGEGKVTAREVFLENADTCRELGIATPMFLASLIRRLYPGEFRISSYTNGDAAGFQPSKGAVDHKEMAGTVEVAHTTLAAGVTPDEVGPS